MADDIQAQTPDGMIHSFPAGTPDAVVDAAIKLYLAPNPPITQQTLGMVSPAGRTTQFPQPQPMANPIGAAAGVGQADELQAQAMSGLANQYVQAGPKEISGGIKDILKGKIAKGANRAISGVGVSSLPIAANVLPIGAMEAPLATGLSLGGSAIGQQVGQRGGTAIGLDSEQAKLAGNIGNIAGGFGGAAIAPSSVTAEPATLGMQKGGAAATVERLANRIPLSSAPLKKVYGQVADNFSQGVADAVSKVAGVQGDKTDLVGTLNSGVASLTKQAKTAYAPVNDYIKNNNPDLVRSALGVLKTAGRQSGLSNEFYENPIAVLKAAAQTEIEKAQQGGADAVFHINNAHNYQTKLGQIMDSLPPEVKASQAAGDALWSKKSAMQDIADTFDKNIEGVPPSGQPAGLAKQTQTIKGTSLLEAIKSEPRLRQAFGPDLASAIVDHAQRLSRAQGMQGGSGLIGGLYGTSILARTFSGYGSTTIPVELGGLYALSKVLATPSSHPFYINMLKASSVAEQDFWAKQAINAAMQPKQNK